MQRCQCQAGSNVHQSSLVGYFSEMCLKKNLDGHVWFSEGFFSRSSLCSFAFISSFILTFSWLGAGSCCPSPLLGFGGNKQSCFAHLRTYVFTSCHLSLVQISPGLCWSWYIRASLPLPFHALMHHSGLCCWKPNLRRTDRKPTISVRET